MKFKITKKGEIFILLLIIAVSVIAGFFLHRSEVVTVYYSNMENADNVNRTYDNVYADVEDKYVHYASFFTPLPIPQTTPVQINIPDKSIQDNAAIDESIPNDNTAVQSGEVTTELININTATAQELTQLKGIGEKLSQRIIEYRNLNGKFKTKQDIMKVSGIGNKKFEDFKDKICVE